MIWIELRALKAILAISPITPQRPSAYPDLSEPGEIESNNANNLSLSLRLVRDYGTVYTQIGVSSRKEHLKEKIHKLLPTVLGIEDDYVDAHSLILNFKNTRIELS